MDKAEAKAERVRLQSLLDDYEAGRLTQQDEDDRRELKRGVTPDRADNVRARIAMLNVLIAEIDGA